MKTLSIGDNISNETDREAYYRSETWKRKVFARLEIDNHRCVLCGSTNNLEVHHRGGNYSSFGNEDIVKDLVTLCSSCHSEQPSSKRSYLLEEGIYDFEVINYSVEQYPGSEKIPPCTQVKLSLHINDEDGKHIRKLWCDLKLVDFLLWKIEHFFASTGLPTSGTTYNNNFQNCVGTTGKCKIVQYKTIKGTINNRVEDFI